MRDAKIFLLGENEKSLIPMVATAYEKEKTLQDQLASYPDLLPGDQIDPENPCRWLLVAQEAGVPGGEAAGVRWSLDHLFLDHEAVPTFVECKRAGDTRARREVVAQMVEYAANGIAYWPMDWLRQAAAETARSRQKSLDDEVRLLIEKGGQEDIEAYWQQVESNLRSGRVRLIFVTEETPPELRRLVEFLNEKMRDVEVLIVEIKQFVGEQRKALVPRVIGVTERSRADKKLPGKPIDLKKFLAECPPAMAAFTKEALAKAEEHRHIVTWGKATFGLRVYLPKEDRFATYLYAYPTGRLEFYTSFLPLSPDQEAGYQKELLAWKGFAKPGANMVKVYVTEENLPDVLKALDFVLVRMDEFARAR